MGWVFDIQRFCLHDGPGLRTTVFLKGCPLRCRWCSNPESQRLKPEMFYNATRCMRCGTCIEACPQALLSRAEDGGVAMRRDACTACGRCADVCPMGALVRKGTDMTVEEIMRTVLKDRDFYTRSGGGLTVSGGEPFAQKDFLYDLLRAAKSANISTAVETSLHADWADIEPCLPLADHVLFDCKHPDTAAHKEWTGVGLEKIMPNIEALSKSHPEAHLRIPVIPGCNTDAEAAEGFARLISNLGLTVELLPYHVLGEGKYEMLAREYPGAAIRADKGMEEAKILQQRLCERGIDAEVHG